MKFTMKKLWVFLAIILIPIIAYAAAPTILRSNILRLGDGATSNKVIEFDEGSGANRPKIRWNDSSSRLELSNDGSTYAGLVGASGTFTANGVIYGDGTSSLQVTGGGSAGQILARPVGGGAPAYVSEVGAIKVNGLGLQAVELDHTNSPYTVLSSDDIITADPTTSAVTLNLPSAVSSTGKIYTIVKSGTSVNNYVIVDPASTETIEGASVYNLVKINGSIKIQSDGSNWIILSERNDWIAYALIDSETVSIPTGSQATFTALAGASLVMELGANSLDAQIPCSSTNASSGLTCSSGNEQLGIVLNVPNAGYVEVCNSGGYRIDWSTDNQVFRLAFGHIRTANDSQTALELGINRPSASLGFLSGKGNEQQSSTFFDICNIFSVAAGQNTFRFAYTANAGGSGYAPHVTCGDSGDMDTTCGVRVRPIK